MDKFDQIGSRVLSVTGQEQEMLDTLSRFYTQWCSARSESRKELLATTFTSLRMIYDGYDLVQIMVDHGWWKPNLEDELNYYGGYVCT